MTIPGPVDEGFQSDDELLLRDAVAAVERNVAIAKEKMGLCSHCGRSQGLCKQDPCDARVHHRGGPVMHERWRVTWDEGDGTRRADFTHHYEAVRWFRSLDCDAKLEEIG